MSFVRGQLELVGKRNPERYSFVHSLVLDISVVAFFSLLVAIGACVKIPLPTTPVPMTLQSLAVLLAGYLLSPCRAAAAMVLYTVCGWAGLPVFTAASAGLTGVTGGFILGFIPCAWLVSVLCRGRRPSVLRLTAAGVAGLFCLFALGIGWMAVWFGDVPMAITLGLHPFVLKAVVQLGLAVTLVTTFRGGSDRVRSVVKNF